MKDLIKLIKGISRVLLDIVHWIFQAFGFTGWIGTIFEIVLAFLIPLAVVIIAVVFGFFDDKSSKTEEQRQVIDGHDTDP